MSLIKQRARMELFDELIKDEQMMKMTTYRERLAEQKAKNAEDREQRKARKQLKQ